MVHQILALCAVLLLSSPKRNRGAREVSDTKRIIQPMEKGCRESGVVQEGQ